MYINKHIDQCTSKIKELNTYIKKTKKIEISLFCMFVK
jgi:hypothetical protein